MQNFVVTRRRTGEDRDRPVGVYPTERAALAAIDPNCTHHWLAGAYRGEVVRTSFQVGSELCEFSIWELNLDA